MARAPQKQKPYQKAGMIISGMLPNGQQALVAPYSEGRFGHQDKYYVLPTGSIDAGETPLHGALREAEEETGIDMVRLLTPEGVAALERGERLTNIPSGYPGVTIRRVEPEPVDHTFLSRASKPRRLALYGIEVDGIEHLRSALKNQPNLNRAGRVQPVRRPISDVLRDAPERYPTFTDFLEWLRTERMPERIWNTGYTGNRDLVPHEDEVDYPTWFRLLEAKHGPITDRDSWQRFCERIPHHDFSVLSGYIATIKGTLKSMHILNGDNDHIKLDDKDCPLFYYQEGADIITAEQYLKTAFERMRANSDYAKAFGGDCEQVRKLAPTGRIQHSQLVGIAPFVREEDITKASAQFMEDLNRPSLTDRVQGRSPYRATSHSAPWLNWGRPTRQAGYSLREPMLESRAAMKQSWEARLAAVPEPAGNARA